MKKLNLLGIRKKVILCRTKDNSGYTYSVMSPIDESQEKELDKYERAVIDGNEISRKSIYTYGEVDLSNKEDVDFINKLHLSDDSDKGNIIHSNFNYDKGFAEYEGNVAKTRPTWNLLEWFKYNYCLIGKPKRIVIYECNKSAL